MTHTRTLRPFRTLSVAVVAAAALTVSACGSGSDDTTEDSAGIEQTTPVTTEDSVPTDDATVESVSPTASMDRGGSLESARTAIDTAEAKNGGTAHHIDFDDNGHWEIDVTASNLEWEYHVSADGTTIQQAEEDDVDADDRKELDDVDVSLIEALEIALEHTPGTIDDAELDDDDGTLRWDIDIHADGSDDNREVIVDARTGDVRGDDSDD